MSFVFVQIALLGHDVAPFQFLRAGPLAATFRGTGGFLREQVLTSRNVNANWFIDLMYGGLNYQIEHHLFPSRPAITCARPVPSSGRTVKVKASPTGKLGSWNHGLRSWSTSAPSAARCEHMNTHMMGWSKERLHG